MTATNHYLTGVAIASMTNKPLIALPLAFISHFVLDALPHFGDKNYRKKLSKFYIVWRMDFAILMVLLLLTAAYVPPWYAVAGFIGTTPDLAWIYRLYFKEKFGKLKPGKMNAFNRFHANIQKWERGWGIYVEFVYGISLFLFLSATI